MAAQLISDPPCTTRLGELKGLTICCLGHSRLAHSLSFCLLEGSSSFQFRDASGEKIFSRNSDGGCGVDFFLAAFLRATAQQEEPN
jgi:hypothetical protein